MLELTHYTEAHQRELRQLFDSPEWRVVRRSGLVEKVRAERIEPAKMRDFISTVVDPLLAFNEEEVQRLIDQGSEDEEEWYVLLE